MDEVEAMILRNWWIYLNQQPHCGPKPPNFRQITGYLS